jgi:putative restriction endonuclease
MANAQLDDKRIRIAAFDWLTKQVALHGDVLPRPMLLQGFEIGGQRVPLVSPAGIFKPRVLPEIPISITTTTSGPYKDTMTPDGRILYKYRGTDPQHRDNVGLRTAMSRNTPLIYFHGLIPGKYMAIWPVFIVGDDPVGLTFSVAVDDEGYVSRYAAYQSSSSLPANQTDDGRRKYITTVVTQRLHQRSFRERVLHAYKGQCALCRLKHSELLDAAHIIPDGDPGGDPIVNNGLALCKLHHAAFDRFFLGIKPDYSIEIRRDILDEDDGPMLLHGLKNLQGKHIFSPTASAIRPSPERLEVRYEKFLASI